MKVKYKVTEFTKGLTSSVYKARLNRHIDEDIFEHGGVKYIVGSQVVIDSKDDDREDQISVELVSIGGLKEMHIHEYYKGICWLCGIYKEQFCENNGIPDKH